MTQDYLEVSENYWWRESSNEFEHRTSHSRMSAESFDAKVAVFEDRVRTWFLDVASSHVVDGSTPADYVALSVALAYIEGVEHYRRGRAASGEEHGPWFKERARAIFPMAEPEAVERLWRAVRCGLFHSGFAEGPTILSRASGEALELSGRFLRINPKAVLRGVIDDFGRYVAELRQQGPSGELGKNFVSLWDRRWEDS
jgi:hypothetical protein